MISGLEFELIDIRSTLGSTSALGCEENKGNHQQDRGQTMESSKGGLLESRSICVVMMEQVFQNAVSLLALSQLLSQDYLDALITLELYRHIEGYGRGAQGILSGAGEPIAQDMTSSWESLGHHRKNRYAPHFLTCFTS